MSRPDQSITFLKSFGYSVFRIPRLGAQPLDILHRNGKDLTRLGSLADFIVGGEVPFPVVRRDDRPGVNIEGTETSKVNASIGLNILGAFIGALGGGNLGLQAGFTRAKTVTFKYSAVTEDSVDVLALEKFIRAGKINPHIPSGTVDKVIEDELYAITSVLKTQKIVVSAQGNGGQSVQLDVPVIQEAVGGNLKVGNEGSVQSSVVFEGAIAIPFAFQAVQMVFNESQEFMTTEQLPAGDAAARARSVAAGDPIVNHQFLSVHGAFARVAE